MGTENRIVVVGGGKSHVPLDTDVLLAAASDDRVATQKAVREFILARVAGLQNPTGMVFAPSEVTVSGADPGYSFIQLNHATVKIALTATPTPGRFLVITQKDAGTVGHTVTLGPGTFDGTNTIATFNAPGETLVLFGLSDTRFAIVLNLGSVAFS